MNHISEAQDALQAIVVDCVITLSDDLDLDVGDEDEEEVQLTLVVD